MTMAKSNEELQSKIRSRLWNTYPDECYQCMRCTSGCTSLKLLELKPHEITILVNAGFIEELVSSDIIWTCASCLKCRERCPQKASPYDTIMALRNMAVEQDAKIPDNYLKVVAQILETSMAEQIKTVTSKDGQSFTRQELGLPEIQQADEKLNKILMKILGG
jgi:heterodisulfide reductase subunit C